MTTKSKNQYDITSFSTFSTTPYAPTTGDSKEQNWIEEQTNAQLMRMQASVQKAAYGARALSYVADVASSAFTQSAQHADALNAEVRGAACQAQVENFNHFNLKLLQKNTYAVEDSLGENLHREMHRQIKEQEKKRGLFGS